MEHLKEILTKVKHVLAQDKKIQEGKQKRGEKFNVFRSLGLWSEEVKLHSRFISTLLNVKGDHGLGEAYIAAPAAVVAFAIHLLDESQNGILSVISNSIRFILGSSSTAQTISLCRTNRADTWFIIISKAVCENITCDKIAIILLYLQCVSYIPPINFTAIT